MRSDLPLKFKHCSRELQFFSSFDGIYDRMVCFFLFIKYVTYASWEFKIEHHWLDLFPKSKIRPKKILSGIMVLHIKRKMKEKLTQNTKCSVNFGSNFMTLKSPFHKRLSVNCLGSFSVPSSFHMRLSSMLRIHSSSLLDDELLCYSFGWCWYIY